MVSVSRTPGTSGVAGEMSLEDRARLGHERPRLDAAGGAVEPHHGVDHLEIFEPHRA